MDVKVYFWGGPEDGAEVKMTMPLPQHWESLSPSVKSKNDKKGSVQKVYRYRLTDAHHRWVYQFEDEIIREEETENAT